MAKKRRSSQFKDSSQVIDIQEARKKRQEKRSRQKEKAARLEEMKKRPVRASIKAAKRRRIVIVIVIMLAFALAIGSSVMNIVKLKGEQQAALEEQKQLKQEKQELEQQLKNSDDPEYIEEKAREQLRLVKPGEKIYVVPDVKPVEKKDDASGDKE